jgi:hypothetical protein
MGESSDLCVRLGGEKGKRWSSAISGARSPPILLPIEWSLLAQSGHSARLISPRKLHEASISHRFTVACEGWKNIGFPARGSKRVNQPQVVTCLCCHRSPRRHRRFHGRTPRSSSRGRSWVPAALRQLAKMDSTGMPGACSRRTRPSGVGSTASSVTMRVSARNDVAGRVSSSTIFAAPFWVCFIAAITRAPLTRSIVGERDRTGGLCTARRGPSTRTPSSIECLTKTIMHRTIVPSEGCRLLADDKDTLAAVSERRLLVYRSREIIAASKRCRVEIASRPRPKCSCMPRIRSSLSSSPLVHKRSARPASSGNGTSPCSRPPAPR